MSREFHFVVVLDEATGDWHHDIGTEDAVLPDGTVFDNDRGEWQIADDVDYERVQALLMSMLDRQNDTKEGSR